MLVFSVFSDIGGFTCEVPIISAPPSNHIGAKSVPPQSHRRRLQICKKMYLFELPNVFVKIEKCICPSLPTGNHIGATFRFAAKSHFDISQKEGLIRTTMWCGLEIVRTTLWCGLEIVRTTSWCGLDIVRTTAWFPKVVMQLNCWKASRTSFHSNLNLLC